MTNLSVTENRPVAENSENSEKTQNDLPSFEAAKVKAELEKTIIKRKDGVFFRLDVESATFQQAVNNLFLSNAFFTELNYPVFIKALFGHGPELIPPEGGEKLIRFAADIVQFSAARRTLYKALKFKQGQAEYFFEPVFLPAADDSDNIGPATNLNFDEFVADLWLKGVRFGILSKVVRNAITSGKSEHLIVAERLEPVKGIDANIVEVSGDIHRSDAPRVLASGKLDLMMFQNRFPQIKKNMRLLKKIPRKIGTDGFELSGIVLEPAIPKDIDLHSLSGLGTVVENTPEGQFLVSQQAGFLSVDTKTQQISIGDKIVSHEGVSARTTGNLHLAGDYEEFGEVQEKRVIEGSNLTLHSDVFGHLISKGGFIFLDANLVNGSAHNDLGDIRIQGVASGSVIQTNEGEITLKRAESCIISASTVVIEHAINCEIIADQVEIQRAEGCAIAARKMSIEQAGPRKQTEMRVFALVPDNSKLEQEIEQLQAKIAQTEVVFNKTQHAMDELTSMPEMRKYLTLVTKVRKKELVLTAEQNVALQKMGLAVGASLKTIGQYSNELKALATAKQNKLEQIRELELKKQQTSAHASIKLAQITGEIQIRTMMQIASEVPAYQHTSKDIKSMLRGAAGKGKQIFSGSSGSFDWTL